MNNDDFFTFDSNELNNTNNKKIHISIKQRNKRKFQTYIEYIPDELDLNILLSEMKQFLVATDR